MALTFTNASSDRVDIGSAAILDNMASFTYLAWILPTVLAPTAARFIVQKGGGGHPNNWSLAGSSTVNINRQYTTSMNATATCANLNMTVNQWWFGGTVNNAKVPSLYGGTLTIPVAEAAAYSVGPTTGVGTIGDDSANAMMYGGNASTGGFPGRIAWVGIWNRALSLGEIRGQQDHPHVTSGCVAFHHLGFNGTGTQPDWSGSANAGTVTGATVSAHVPIFFRASRGLYVPKTASIVAPGQLSVAMQEPIVGSSLF